MRITNKNFYQPILKEKTKNCLPEEQNEAPDLEDDADQRIADQDNQNAWNYKNFMEYLAFINAFRLGFRQ